MKVSLSNLTSQYPDYKIIVTGHSLGAAIATLISLDLQNDNFKNVHLMNFGSPRVGNTEFANFTTNQLIDASRVTHYKDTVPHVSSLQF